jgi:hypothetical protein
MKREGEHKSISSIFLDIRFLQSYILNEQFILKDIA